MIKCKALEHGVLIDKNGNLRPCCNYKSPSNLNINSTTLESYIKSEYVKNIKDYIPEISNYF